jgi:signal transduction histidine kinase/PAS domain-containing protein
MPHQTTEQKFKHQPAITRLSTRLHLVNKAVLVVVSLCIVLTVNYLQKQQALQHAERESLILLQHNLALHSYFNQQLKPRLFKLTETVRKPSDFDPVWMSSTYAVRSIDTLYRQQSGSQYYYKEAAINARSPENEADGFERELIERLKREPSLQKLSGIRRLDEKPYFYTLIRGESMEQSCLRCHSTPDKAPGDMVHHYGPQRSFNRFDGELVSAISIRVPLNEAYQAANQFSLKLSLALIAVLFGMYLLQKRMLQALVNAPLARLQAQTDAIANDPEQLGRQIPLEATREMNAIASSFNTMSTRLKSFVESLEQTVTERTRDLTESEAKLRLLFENMTTGFASHQMLYDQQGSPCDYRFLEINPAFEQLTGLKASAVVGKTVLEILPDTEPFWIETYGAVASSGQAIAFKHYAPDLKRHYQVWAFCPQPGYFATLFSDITETVTREQQLRQSQKLQSIGRLAAGIAHDFNNKLMVIRGNAELAQMALPDTTKLLPRLELIIQTADQSRDIIGQLVAFSRQQPVEPRQVNLNQLLETLQATLGCLIGDDIQISLQPGQDVWSLLIDPIQIEQIVMNLALNARDAMPQGGQITIATENVTLAAHPAPGNQSRSPGDYVLLSMSDTGSGMDADTLEHIFEPFFTTKDVGKGTGLGLATIHGIVVQNNGFIEVSSQPGHGSTFSIYLPRPIQQT